jgi:hypothetical protein
MDPVAISTPCFPVAAWKNVPKMIGCLLSMFIRPHAHGDAALPRKTYNSTVNKVVYYCLPIFTIHIESYVFQY